MNNHNDLLGSGHGHRRHHEPERPEVHIEVPVWAEVLFEQQELILKEIRDMKQSTSDLIAVVNDLVTNSKAVDEAIDALVEAQAGDDSDAVETAVSNLKSLKSDQDAHLSKLVTAAPVVVAAPADLAPVTIKPAE